MSEQAAAPGDEGLGIMTGEVEIMVETVSGLRFSRHVEQATGSLGLPVTDAELLTKFRECAAIALGSSSTESAVTMLLHLDEMLSLKELSIALTTDSTRTEGNHRGVLHT